MTYRNLYETRTTPQMEQAKPSQVKNSAGGYTFTVTDWTRLERFLVLGSDSPTYYASAKQLTKENAQAVQRCMALDGRKTVDTIVAISDTGRAPKNEPALFALAMCTGLGDNQTRQRALEALPQVARTGTHLFHFAEYVEGFRGWGRGLRRAVANWYNAKSPQELAYQILKYQQRDKWAHGDLLRLAHPSTTSEQHNIIYKYILKGEYEGGGLIAAFEQAKKETRLSEVVKLITEHGLTREMLPTQWLNEGKVWEALLDKMPLTAMMRNLGKMSEVGLLKPMSTAVQVVVSRLNNQEYIKKSRLHPLSILVALNAYSRGKGIKGSLSWNAVPQIVDALDNAFYLSFGNIEPTNKRWVLALDVSGSMGFGEIAGMTGITPRVGSAAMAMVAAKTESKYAVIGFSHHLVPIHISPRQRLDDVIKTIEAIPMGGTDCSLPILWAMQNNIPADVFVVYTDNETWAGNIHPFQALQQYRQKMGVPAKMIVVGMTSTQFTIADPEDGGSLDVVGFDTAAPQVMRDFVVQ